MGFVKLYTDGACSGNPGPGGWGFAVIDNEVILYSNAKFFSATTNNQMELSAAIEGLTYIVSNYGKGMNVSIFTDSAYTMNAMKDWVHKWKKNNWNKANGKPIENGELIKKLYRLCYESNLNISWCKVKAHQNTNSISYDRFNDYVDKLATGKEKPKTTR